jgi:hypothetical protein
MAEQQKHVNHILVSRSAKPLSAAILTATARLTIKTLQLLPFIGSKNISVSLSTGIERKDGKNDGKEKNTDAKAFFCHCKS